MLIMDNYEVNVLTRKGGWKKLQQEMGSDTQTSSNINNNPSQENEITNELIQNNKDEFLDNNVFQNFDVINNIIVDLQNLEGEKTKLIEKLNSIEANFNTKKEHVSFKLDKVTKEFELYEKAIKLIKSLKNI